MRRREVSPLCLPSPTHPLKDLNKAQRLQEQAKVHPQASHPGRSHSIQQEPTPPSAHSPLPIWAAPVLLPATPLPHPLTPHWAGPTPCYLMPGLVPPRVTSHWGSSAPNQRPGEASPRGRGEPSCVGWVPLPRRTLSVGQGNGAVPTTGRNSFGHFVE